MAFESEGTKIIKMERGMTLVHKITLKTFGEIIIAVTNRLCQRRLVKFIRRMRGVQQRFWFEGARSEAGKGAANFRESCTTRAVGCQW